MKLLLKISVFLALAIASAMGVASFWDKSSPHNLPPLGARAQAFEPDPTTDSIGARIENGKVVQTLRKFNRWVNYKTAEGWGDIDTSLTQTTRGFVMNKAPFEFTAPLVSQGTALFHNNNLWDEKTKTGISAPPLDLTITALGISNVSGEARTGNLGFGDVDYVVYPNAYPSVSFTNGFFRPTFAMNYSSGVDFFRDVNGTKTRWLQGSVMGTNKAVEVQATSTTENRGASMDAFKIWDMNEDHPKKQNIQVDFEPLGGRTYNATKLVPQSFFATSSPVSADLIYYIGKRPAPNLQKLVCFKDAAGGYIACTDLVVRFGSQDATAGNLVDGTIRREGEATWAGARDATTASEAPGAGGSDSNCPNTNQVVTFTIIYCIYGFNTGDIIQSTDTINEARLGLDVNSPGEGDNAPTDENFWVVVQADPASDTSLTQDDYNNVTDVNNSNPHASGVELKAMSPFSTSSTSWIDASNLIEGRVEWVFDATGTAAIAKAGGGLGNDGFSFFGMTSSFHVVNDPPALTTQMNFGSDFAEGANPPYLEVDISSSTPPAADEVKPFEVFPQPILIISQK